MTGQRGCPLHRRPDCCRAEEGQAGAWPRAGVWPHLLLAVAFCLPGCQSGGGVDETYGTSRSPSAARSLNGTTVFAELLRQKGYRPTIASRVTPRIARYGLIVWFHTPGGVPDPAIRKRIDDWLLADSTRRLLYVGGDHDAAVSYWDGVGRGETGAQARTALRQRAEAMARADSPSTVPGTPDPDCWWFDVSHGSRMKLDSVVVDAGRKLDTSGSTVELGRIRLVPGNRSRELLSGSGDAPLAFYPADPDGHRTGQVLVVSNGSFLLNRSLIDTASRQLATEVIGELAADPDSSRHVVFLVSGSLGWSDTVYENETAWSWINQPPLSFVVPHFLVLGVCFLFTLLPVLGRRRKLEADEQPGFARHLEAIGQLAARSSGASAIDGWRKQVAVRRGKSGPQKSGPVKPGASPEQKP